MQKNRGMLLEKIINKTIDYYAKNKLAYIEKKSLPVKFKKVENDNLKLDEAYILKKSTVDYIGCYKGFFVAFEAKSTNEKRLPANNITRHQIKYLLDIESNSGLAFFIIFFSFCDEFYLVKASELIQHMNKSISYEEIKNIGFRIELTFPGIIDFLPYVQNFY